MTRILFAGFIALTTVGAGVAACLVAIQALPAGDPIDPPGPVLVQPAGPADGPAPVEVTAWGAEEAGLRLRVKAVKKIEQGMPLEATLEWSVGPGKLPAGIKHLNSFLYAGHATLVLVHGQSGKQHTVKPYDPTAGMPASDNGKTKVALDGSPIKPWLVRFPLVTLGDSLEPGPYIGRIQFSFPNKPTSWWSGQQADWDAAGFWHGTAQSGDLMLTVLKSTPKSETFVLPKQLRLDKDLKVIFTKEDAESIALPLRNGHFVSAKVSRNGQSYSLRDAEGLQTYDIDQWRDYKGGPITSTYTIAIFETADPPVHKWHPGPGSGGYKVLWQKSFTLSFTEEQIKKIQMGAAQ